MQGPVIVHGVVSKVTGALHLIDKPSIDALVEMRWFYVQERDTQGCRQRQNANFNPGEFFQPCGHAN
jgi:hypothetical protein